MSGVEFIGVLFDHKLSFIGDDPRCSCGEKFPTYLPAAHADYREHLAAQLNAAVAEWLRSDLAAEDVAVKAIVQELGLIWPEEFEPMHREAATAALSALAATVEP